MASTFNVGGFTNVRWSSTGTSSMTVGFDPGTSNFALTTTSVNTLTAYAAVKRRGWNGKCQTRCAGCGRWSKRGGVESKGMIDCPRCLALTRRW